MAIGIRDDYIFRSELGKELLNKFQRRIILNGQRGLIHVNAEIEGVVPETFSIHSLFFNEGSEAGCAVHTVTVRGTGVESHGGICIISNDAQSVLEFVGSDIPEHP